MPSNITDATKIDRAFKLTSGVAYTTSNKSLFEEAFASNFITRSNSIFIQDNNIPIPAPGSSTASVIFRNDYAMTADNTVATGQSWLSGLTNWVPPTFDITYNIRIFLVNSGGSHLQEVFLTDSTGPLFDYKSGILTFDTNPLPLQAGAVGIHINGYSYIGETLDTMFDADGYIRIPLTDSNTNPGTCFAGFTASKGLIVNPGSISLVALTAEGSIIAGGAQGIPVFTAIDNNLNNKFSVDHNGYPLGHRLWSFHEDWMTFPPATTITSSTSTTAAGAIVLAPRWVMTGSSPSIVMAGLDSVYSPQALQMTAAGTVGNYTTITTLAPVCARQSAALAELEFDLYTSLIGTYIVRVGMVNVPEAPSTTSGQGAWFSTTGSVWQINTCDGSSTTTVSTTTTLTSNILYSFRIELYGSALANMAIFYINGSNVGQITTTLPLSSTALYLTFMAATNATNASTRTITLGQVNFMVNTTVSSPGV